MRQSVYFTLLFFFSIFVSFLLVQSVAAETKTSVSVSGNADNSHTNVNVQSNTGGSTVCQNGTCTTTKNGESKSTVCVNGKCTTSTDGTVDIEEENAKIHINTNTSNNATSSPTPSVTPTGEVQGIADKAERHSRMVERHEIVQERMEQKKSQWEHIFENCKKFFMAVMF